MGCCCCRRFRRSTGSSGALDESSSLVRSLIVSDREPYQPRVSFTLVTDQPFDPCKSYVEWNHSDDIVSVGLTIVATVKFIRRDGTVYLLKNCDQFRYKISHDDQSVTVRSIREPSASLVGHQSVRVSFTPRIIGNYTLTFKLNAQRIGGQSHIRIFTAGPPVIGRTIIHNQINYMILQCGVYYTITISPRDEFGNIARVNGDLLYFTVTKGGASGTILYPDCVTEEHYDVSRLDVLVKLDEPGYYNGSLKYEETVIGLQNCVIICLTEEGMQKKEQNIQTNFLNIEHKAKLIPQNKNEESRKVKCYISPRLLQIREQSWLLFTSRLFTCRVCNSTRIHFHDIPGQFTIDDGLQTPVTLISENREVIAAIFYTFIQRNSGGAETFQEKQRHFQTELKAANDDNENRPTTVLNVRRYNLLESAMHATRGFKTDTWKSKFYVNFEGEDGIDLGGVSREFFNCLCDIIFGGRNPKGLFTRFTDNPQGLVHPTNIRKRDSSLGVQHYEFAGRIVGKCLFETALGNPFFVKAHLTRSFLAQLIGLRISWKHFETDNPEVYRFRVEQIRNSSLEELDLSLTFADEVVEDGGLSSNPLIVSLNPGGSKQRVTDGNKMDYLTQLAQYRLVRSVSEEVRHFIKGLREFVPDELLAMFDENELELLMCGVQKLSFPDLKQHTEIRGHTSEFLQSVEWFWTAVSEFSPEELARLVQFVTGSSQIPPGGFSELIPPFLLASSGLEYNQLPYAHTCFNHLCLPNYDTYEQFRRSLMTAINEGSEGILLS